MSVYSILKKAMTWKVPNEYSAPAFQLYCQILSSGSSFAANLTTPTNTAGVSGSTTAPNSSDIDYVTGVARGGSTNGGPGEVVIYW